MQQLQIINKVIALTCLLSGIAFAQDASKKILDRVAGGEHIKTEEVAPEDRPQVISGIKTFLKERRDYGVRLEAIELLVRLKDDETIRDLVNKYHSDPSKEEGFLRLGANSEIIPFVAPDLSLPKDAGKQFFGDVGVPATRDWAASLILWCIVNSPEFPAKTQAWAHTDGRDDWSKANQWWTHNKDAVLAKRYQDATWLPPATAPTSK